MKELKNLRKRNEKHFLNSDGTISAYIYNKDIHYLKNDVYEEIDNTLIDDGNSLVNKENAFQTFFRKDKNSKLIVDIEKDKHYLKMSLNKNKSSKLKLSSEKEHVHFQDILKDIDFDYQLVSTKLKESIILKNKNNIPKLFSFVIDTDLILRINQRKIEAKDEDGNLVFLIDAPYMMDANQNYNDRLTYSLKKREEDYLLTLKLDYEWLEKAEFPVVIDPTIVNPSDNEWNVYDTYISKNNPDNNYDQYEFMYLGVNDKNDVRRILTKFNLPLIGTGCEVIQASAYFMTQVCRLSTATMEVHQITSEWKEDTATWNNMYNQYLERVEDFNNSCPSSMEPDADIFSFDVTNLVKKWYAGEPNYGFMLKWQNEVYTPGESIDTFITKTYDMVPNRQEQKRPVLVITYRNLNGLEDYLSYQTQNYTDGSSYINNLTGNLTTSFLLNETIGGKYPIQLNMIYNTNNVVLKEDIGYGLGYQLSLHETIKEVKIDSVNYLEYIDADGTIHYFVQDRDDEGNAIDNRYIDEDGLGLHASKSENQYLVNDKSNNQFIFTINGDTYYLTELINTNQDKVTIRYDASKRINQIVDANHSEINITYHDGNTIIQSDHRTTTIYYTNNQITRLVTKNGNTNFTYNSLHLLERITDVTGLSNVFSYYEAIPYKVKKIMEYGINDTEGESLTFQYGFMVTRVIDHKGRYHSYSFNERGNTIGVTNLDGEQNLSNAYGKGMVYTSDTAYKENSEGSFFLKASKAANHLMTEILPVKYTKNLMKNSSFEEEVGLGRTSFVRTDEYARTGKYSFKIEGSNALTEYVESNKTYTFSGYFKNDEKIEVVAETQADATEPCYLYFGSIPANKDFTRYQFTFTLPENKELVYIGFTVENNGIAYLDDVQIEEGEVANYYNLLENGDFRDGLNGWEFTGNQEDGDGVVTLTGGVKALKFNPKPGVEKLLSRTITGIKGTKTTEKSGIGDIYYLSFWYKNTGLNKPSPMIMGQSGISVLLNFGYTDDYEYPGCAIPLDIIANNDEWQFYSVPFYSDSAGNYENLYFTLFVCDNANEFYITNISLSKDIEQNYHLYNEDTGNLEHTRNMDGSSNEFKYDKNNQLTSMFQPKGNNFVFEYDNVVTDRVLKGVSPTGISNEIEYDSFGNPIKTLINNVNPEQEVRDKKNYHIRLKGTNQYWDCDFMHQFIYLKEDDCSHDAFTLIKEGDYYRFSIGNLYLTYQDNRIILNKTLSDSTLFKLTKNPNGSYLITPKSKYSTITDEGGEVINVRDFNVAVVDGILTIKNDDTEDENQQFFFLDIDTPLFIESKAEYTKDGKFITKTIDSLGKETNYDINPINGLTNSITDSKGSTTYYSYNDKEQITKVLKENKDVNYTYNNQNLLSFIHSGNKYYHFSYDNFLNTKEIDINAQILVTNEYENNHGNLMKTTYGNGDTITYTYDSLDRVKTITDSSKTYTNVYDNVGNLVKIKASDGSYQYTYDFSQRLSKYSLDDDYYTIQYDYDSNNNITKKDYHLGQNETVEYEYNQDDAIAKVIFDGNQLNYTYDYLGRLISKDINGKQKQEYGYITNGKKTSTILKSMKVKDDLYEYQYDSLYNITDIYCNKKLIHHYEYDQFNELIEEDNYILNKTIRYTYDTEGNILAKKEYELNTYNLKHTDYYQYNNPNWEDQLTKYNDEEITYDAIGNPITIGNKKLTWTNGRELATYQDNNLMIQYSYNKDGIRRYKKVNDVVTSYLTEGSKIIFEQTGNDVIYYIRDEEGSLIGFKYNDTMYYYIKNMQEDIIGITDKDFNLLCQYEYDSWGKVISIKDNEGGFITDPSHIGYINLYRYRSYYYDSETGLYYLNSRYYNPEWGRFINADGIINGNQDFIGHNLYAYVSNNSIDFKDDSGSTLMPTWQDIKNIGKKAMQLVTTVVSSTVGFFLSTNSAASLLNKSMNNPNGKMNRLTKNKLRNNISNSPEMKKIVDACVEKNKNNFKYTCSGSETFNSNRDLHLSVNNANYSIEGTNNPISGLAFLKINVNDIYDFTEKKEWNSFSNIANNIGHYYQDKNILKPYYWDIDYVMTLPYK